MSASNREYVTNANEAVENIHRFSREVLSEKVLVRRLSYVQSWYAVRQGSSWVFGPSKFIGYRNNTAKKYIAYTKSPHVFDGRETERALEGWFEQVDEDTRLGRELREALETFLHAWKRRPNSRARINVLKSELSGISAVSETGERSKRFTNKRIVTNPRICGGRPTIKGTRMRVSDLLQMMAEGATREEICADFPYLTPDDIAAALAFAARASDHRIIRAA